MTPPTTKSSSTPKSITPNNAIIHWFRTDLRLHDNPTLCAALARNPDAFYPVFTLDPYYIASTRSAVNRWKYLLDCLNDLNASIKKLNPKSQLFLLRGSPEIVLPRVCKQWGVTTVSWEKDGDGYAKGRDGRVREVLGECGVEVIERSGRTLWDCESIVKANGGQPTMTIAQLRKAGEKVGPIAKPLASPKSIPNPGTTQLSKDQSWPPANSDADDTQTPANVQALTGPMGDFAVPTLEELDLPAATTPYVGGENYALRNLDELCTKRKEYIATFAKPATNPTSTTGPDTTMMSSHLHFGSLSIREFYWRVDTVLQEWAKLRSSKPALSPATEPPTSLLGQLLFRDMYFAAQEAIGPTYYQMLGNKTVRFIPWHLPSVYDEKTGLATGAHHIDDPQAEEYFQRWKHGITGFPWIDGLMRQLKQEGWIHHLGRHAVACFLTRGGCYVDWERGAEVFAEWLLDHEPASNGGNWQWLSCTAFFSQFYRVYSPVAFPQKWDKDGEFIRKWVPELKNFNKKYIYEPSKAPIADQKAWGCKISGNGSATEEAGMKVYPKPMFDFVEQRQICLDGMKKAYEIGLYGIDKKVKDGSWRNLFDDDVGDPKEKGAKTIWKNGSKTNHVASNGHAGTHHDHPAETKHAPKRKQQGTLDGLVKRTKK